MANSKNVVVTGVSTGIGWRSTKVLFSKGFRVFGSVRKPADADRLQRELGNGFGYRTALRVHLGQNSAGDYIVNFGFPGDDRSQSQIGP